MSLLTIVQNAAGSLSLPIPTAVIAASDPLWHRLASQEGKQLASGHDWQVLVVPYTFTAIATVTQSTSGIATDFDHFVADVEIWNRSTNTLLRGPTPSDIWTRLQSGVTGGVTGWWRRVGNQLCIFPAPTAGHTIAYEYVSNRWVSASGDPSTPISDWAADSDVARIPEDVMELGLIWRWLRAKERPYLDAKQIWATEAIKKAGRDRGVGILTVGGRSTIDPPAPFWNGTIG